MSTDGIESSKQAQSSAALSSTVQATAALITGASAGLGAAFARLIASSGQYEHLILVARRAEALKALAAELPAKTLCIELDLLAPQAVERLVEQCSSFSIKLLVNNAGYGLYGPFSELDLSTQLDLMRLNVLIPLELTHRLLPRMEAGSGILNVASLAGVVAMGGFASYAASKAAMLSWSLGLHAELASRRISVSALCPGPIDTEFARVASRGRLQTVRHGYSPQRVAAAGLAAVWANRGLCFGRFSWAVAAWFFRFMPRAFMAKMALKHRSR